MYFTLMPQVIPIQTSRKVHEARLVLCPPHTSRRTSGASWEAPDGSLMLYQDLCKWSPDSLTLTPYTQMLSVSRTPPPSVLLS